MHNPVRRSRNIGKAKQGHGQNNRFQIPDTWMDAKVFYERLKSPIMVKRAIRGKEYIFLIEPTLKDYTHPCTVDDIEKLIELFAGDICYIDIIVLRQPSRKQVIMSSVWGRLAFYYEADACEGTAIVIEAQQINKPKTWSKSLGPELQRELSRLKNDGHQIKLDKRKTIIETSLESCRNTQLYRTIPHEVGHYMDFITSGEAGYDLKTKRQKEDYAHRYADDFIENMEADFKIPFDRIFDEKSLANDWLSEEWFV